MSDPYKNIDCPWRGEETLREMYIDRRMSSHEIADLLGCHNKTILRWLRKFGIEIRGMREGIKLKKLKQPASLYVNSQGYLESSSEINGQKSSVGIHRLVAIAYYGVNAVVDKQVHHDNGVKWDNRPQNLQLLGEKEHGAIHGNQRNFDMKIDKEMCDEIAERAESETQYELSSEYGVSQATINYHSNKKCHHE